MYSRTCVVPYIYSRVHGADDDNDDEEEEEEEEEVMMRRTSNIIDDYLVIDYYPYSGLL